MYWHEYLNLNPRIIFCTRDKEDTINSFKKIYKHKEHLAVEMVENRLENLNEALKGKKYLTIDCYEEGKELKVKKWYNKVYD